jgi:hypothetical protein
MKKYFSYKHAHLFLILFLGISACSSKMDKASTPSGSQESQIETGRTEKSTESDSEFANQQTQDRKKVYGVWIDGAGFESLMALGVLQELEKNNIRPAKVVGTGFGCWIALSWALGNSGSQAEWQSFKWKDWNLAAARTIIDKIGGDSVERLRIDVKKHFLKKSFQEFSVPVDCPFTPKSKPFKFQTAKFVDVDLALAIQLQVPFSEFNFDFKEKRAWNSGAWMGVPFQSELTSSAREIVDKLKPDEEWGGWIVLKTRSSEDTVIKHPYLDKVLADRTPELKNYSDSILIDLRQGAAPYVSTQIFPILKSESRRAWLLEGRRQASGVLKSIRDRENASKESY